MRRTGLNQGFARAESLSGVGVLLQFSYLQLLDLLTTIAFLANGVSEGNPIVAFAIRNAVIL
jgi:hypothetical protein